MKRIFALLFAVMMFCGIAFAEGHTELIGYLGVDIEVFAQDLNGVEASDFDEDGDRYASSDSFSVYASIDSEEGGTGLIDYISLEEIDDGYCLCGITIGMSMEEAAAVTADLGLSYEVSDSEEGIMVYYPDGIEYAIFVTYVDGVASVIDAVM